MRDPKRIERILELVKQIWKKSPDQRLCQLIHNAVSMEDVSWHGKDQFYASDEILEKGLYKLMELFI